MDTNELQNVKIDFEIDSTFLTEEIDDFEKNLGDRLGRLLSEIVLDYFQSKGVDNFPHPDIKIEVQGKKKGSEEKIYKESFRWISYKGLSKKK